ncbi:MAG: polysaccharide pyruvyl transferase family protein [Oscillospiraceae bacterium]|nr:polysaccharide pyruvyl transferase family protein [Oscillospiraceae bacterium]
MKFANYKYVGKNINNLGDHVQIITVDYLYSLMGLSEEDIVIIDKDDLQAYDGEQVLLPVSMPLIDYKESGIAGMFSSKITPVFFGLTMAKDELLSEEIEYLKAHEPIGCRDERTYNTLVQSDIDAYLGGCLTITLPKREANSGKQNKVFIIDPTVGLNDFIPAELTKEAVFDTHMFYEKLDNPKQKAKDRYKQYEDEAKLVITSLLHCSVPCIAMGIPVILAKDIVSYRFAWLEALLKIYTPEEYSDINWNPIAVEYEQYKEQVRTLFIKRMYEQDATTEINTVHEFYMNRNRKDYIIDAFIGLQKFIDETWVDYNKEYRYAIWGLTQMADMTVSYISKRYPNAKLMHAYDLQEGLKFKGIKTQHPDNIATYPDETVFVTTVSAASYAKQYFIKINRPEHLFKTLDIIV